jgi:Spy/CpxP family protein refolding chaperone
MKKIFTSLLIVLLVCSISIAQKQKQQNNRNLKPLQKIEQLEKAKIIEALNLSEETAVRLFARRNESQQKVREAFRQKDELLKELEQSLKSNAQMSDAEYRERVNTINAIDASMFKERDIFYRSLGDLLSPKQIAKFIVFENNFRKEIKRSLMDKGHMPNKD